jgi:hypothetical protein
MAQLACVGNAAAGQQEPQCRRKANTSDVATQMGLNETCIQNLLPQYHDDEP